MVREAQQYLERAQALDPEGVIPQAFIHKVRRPSRQPTGLCVN
jgi:hypothetical protein